jgi:DNA invertase Pin-like site-specific DNA recombinase
MKYFLYVRRSSDENSHKQTQSLEGQLLACQTVQQTYGLEITDIFQESKTAKKPGRPQFNEMLRRIHRGEATGILCYHLDRLSRNPKDSGDIRWMLQQGTISEIRTPSQIYLPKDSCLITGIETTMAEQFIIHHTERVERGMRQKHRAGGFPHRAPEGYLNNRVDKTIEVDPLRFPLLRRAWELLLTDTCSVPHIHRKLHKEWGYQKRPTLRTVRTELPLSHMYMLFVNPFYAGIGRSWGETYQGSWTPMVSVTEFEEAQRILGKRACPHPVKYVYPYTGFIQCRRCGCQITAETSKGHTYYHCTNRRGNCSAKGIRAEQIDEQIASQLDNMSIFPEFAEWACEVLKREKETAQKNQQAEENSHSHALRDLEAQRERLLTMRLKDQITEEEYLTRRSLLQEEEVKHTIRAEPKGDEVEREHRSLQNIADFVSQAPRTYRTDDDQTRRLVARHLARAYWLLERDFQIELNECLAAVLTGHKKIKAICGALEPLDIGSDKVPEACRDEVIQVWWATLEAIRTTIHDKGLEFPALLPDRLRLPDPRSP